MLLKVLLIWGLNWEIKDNMKRLLIKSQSFQLFRMMNGQRLWGMRRKSLMKKRLKRGKISWPSVTRLKRLLRNKLMRDNSWDQWTKWISSNLSCSSCKWLKRRNRLSSRSKMHWSRKFISKRRCGTFSCLRQSQRNRMSLSNRGSTR